jgi:hypothetical protein
MPEEIVLKEAQPPIKTLKEDAVSSLEEQKQVAEKEFKNCAITVVLQLMPVDDHPQGRMGLLSVRNDDDPPLFTTPLRGEELAEFLEIPSLAGLIEELTNLLPRRLEERAAKASDQAKPPSSQVAGRSAGASVKGAKGGQKSTYIQPETPAKTVSSALETTASAATTKDSAVSQSVFTPESAPEVATEGVGDTTRQLTLF